MEERAKHSIVYDTSTSEIKDDIVQLCGCFKTNQGALKRQEAAFLLWYHALSGAEKAGELVSNNIISTCLSLVDASETTPVDKSCAAGILSAVCQPEENREVTIRGKASSGNAVVILHRTLETGGDLALLYVSSVLRQVAEEAVARTALLKIMEQKLGYGGIYCRVLSQCKDHTTTAHLCGYLKALFHQRDDLIGEAIEQGFVETMLSVIKAHKAEQTVCMALGCLLELTQSKESWARLIKADGLRILIDVLGPPPSPVVRKETELWWHLIERANAVPKLLRKEEEEQAKSEERLKLISQLTVNAREDAAEVPEPDMKNLLSVNSSGLKWGHSIITLPTISSAAGCLYELCQNTEHMHYMSRRLVAARLVPLISIVMQAEGDAKKKKGKKKGLNISPEQIEALTRVTGCLKFLTMVNTNRYRVAQLGATKALKPIYDECGITLLRRNTQCILSNIAMLKENGQILLDSKLPPEFLVSVPLKLSDDEVEQLSVEYDGLKKARRDAALED